MKRATFTQHLEELRRRIMVYAITLILVSMLSFRFSEKFLVYLLGGIEKTVFLSPVEGFFVHLKIALFAGFLISLPLLFYEAWAFLVSALKKEEARFIKIFSLMSLILFLGGALFAFKIILPLALSFFLSFESPMMQAMISTNQYLGFLFTLVISFGFVFELPLVVVCLTKLGLIGPGILIQRRKFALLMIFILAAILTPPDVVTQILMALPLLVLYEIAIVLSRIFAKRSL